MMKVDIEDLRVCPVFLFQGLSFLMPYQPGKGALGIVQVSEDQGIGGACVDTVRHLPFLNPVNAQVTSVSYLPFLSHEPDAIGTCQGTEFASDTFIPVHGHNTVFIDETGPKPAYGYARRIIALHAHEREYPS